MESFVRDLRFGWRSLWRSPGFTLVAVLTLGLGVGANAAIISLVWSIFFRPLPFSEPENLQVILQEGRQGLSSISLPDLEDLKSRNRVYDSVALVREVDRNLSNGIDPAKRVKGLLVSWEFLNTLGVDLHMGRGFLQDEDRLGANPTALLSHSLWQGHFGSDPSLLGQVIQLDGEPFTVIGILPPALEREPIAPGALLGDLWLPIGLYSDQMEPEERASRKGVFALGRLKDGVSRWDAASDLGRISRELATEYPLSNKNYRFHADTFRDSQLGSDRTALFAALMMVVLVLLIACTNLVNLILSRQTQRRREFRIRAALGAEQSRIVQLLLAENLLWGLLGGILGGFLALEILRILPSKLDGLLHSLSLTELGRIATLVWPVALLLGLLVGVGIGVLPAWRASRLSTLPQSSWGRAFGTGDGTDHAAPTEARIGSMAVDVSRNEGHGSAPCAVASRRERGRFLCFDSQGEQ